MIKVELKEMVKFILEQPDEKKVDMAESCYRDDCGCLMVQYGKHQGWEFSCCNTNSWVDFRPYIDTDIAKMSKDFRFFLPEGITSSCKTTFSALKDRVKEILNS